MTVVQLRKALEERGLDTKGLKAALVQRYQKALDNDAKNSAPADAGDDADKPAADDAVDVGDAKPDSAAAMDDDAVSLGGDDKDDLGDAPEYASTEQQAQARLADSDRSGRPADDAGDRDRSKSRERSPPGQASKSQLEPDRKNAEGATAENGPKLFCAICGERGHRFKACPPHPRLRDSQGRVPHLRRCVAQDVLVPAAQDRSRPRVPHLQEEGARAPQLPG